MDITIFNLWLEELLRPYICYRTWHKVFFILDKVICHSTSFDKDRIRVIFFPSNITFWKQSKDTGIIATVKKNINI